MSYLPIICLPLARNIEPIGPVPPTSAELTANG